MDDMSHASAPALPPGAFARPEHGTWEGHVLPGGLFCGWALWMLLGTFRAHFGATKQRPFQSPAWSGLPAKGRWQGAPLEPILKVALTSFGILCELWLGHVSYRRLYDAHTGRFAVGNLQDWQHSAMYAAFGASGLVDLACHALPLRLPGVEHAFLGLAFTVEGLLFGFHLKGSGLDRALHLLLVLTVLAAAAVCFAEVRWRGSVLLSALRAQLVLLQGIWFCQIAAILFTGRREWDPGYHGSTMAVAPLFAAWLLAVALGTFAAFAACSTWAALRPRQGPHKPYGAVYSEEGEGWAGAHPAGAGAGPEIEVTGLRPGARHLV